MIVKIGSINSDSDAKVARAMAIEVSQDNPGWYFTLDRDFNGAGAVYGTKSLDQYAPIESPRWAKFYYRNGKECNFTTCQRDKCNEAMAGTGVTDG